MQTVLEASITPNTAERLAWSLKDISETTGLSVGFLRNEVRAKRLQLKKFGRRVLVLDTDLKAYLASADEWQPGEWCGTRQPEKS